MPPKKEKKRNIGKIELKPFLRRQALGTGRGNRFNAKKGETGRILKGSTDCDRFSRKRGNLLKILKMRKKKKPFVKGVIHS